MRGNPVWRIARLAPGRTRTLRLYARFDADTGGRLCNNVRVRASNARGDRGRTCTLVRRLVRQVSPAVTG